MELQTTVRMLAKADKLNGLWVLTEIAIACSFLPKSWRLSAALYLPEQRPQRRKTGQTHHLSVGKAVMAWLRWRKTETGLFANPEFNWRPQM